MEERGYSYDIYNGHSLHFRGMDARERLCTEVAPNVHRS